MSLGTTNSGIGQDGTHQDVNSSGAPKSSGSDFLGTLPDAGRYVIQAKKGKIFLKPKFFDDKQDLLDYAQNYKGTDNLFHAIGGFGEDSTRKGENCVAMRSFVLDVDTNENTGESDDTKFDTKREALAFVRDKMKELKFIAPNHAIETSAGWHLYWKIDTDIEPQVWQRIAQRFRFFLKTNLGKAAVDTSRVADLAGVLRPPGMVIRKEGRQPFTTKELVAKPQIPLSAFTDALDRLAGSAKAKTALTAGGPGRGKKACSLGGDGLVDAMPMLTHCAAMTEYKKNQASAGYDAWRSALALTAYTKQGEQLAHELSEGHEGYDFDATQTKYDEALANKDKGQAPITCETFCGHVGLKREAACKGCPQYGKANASPVNLTNYRLQLEDTNASANVVTGNGDTGLPDGYLCSGEWIMRKENGTSGNGNDESGNVAINVCSRIRFVSRARDENGTGWGKRVELHQPDGKLHTTFVPDATAVNAKDLVEYLSDKGVRFPGHHPAEHKRVQQLFAAAEPKRNDLKTTKAGWHGEQYVRTDGSVIGSGKDQIVYEGSKSAEQCVSGTLEDWKTHVALPVIGQSIPTIAMCAVLAAPFRSKLGEGGVIFHLGGKSGRGKTTSATVGMSVRGHARTKPTWNRTQNGVELGCYTENDGAMTLDEIHQAKTGVVAEVAYMLPNGSGKVTMTQDRRARESFQWTTTALSTGEATIEGHIARDSKFGKQASATAGQLTRALDIPADMGTGHGAFDFIPDGIAARDYVEGLSAAAAMFHGSAEVALIAAYAKDPAKWTHFLETKVREFEAGYVKFSAVSEPQVLRVLRHFAVFYAAGCFATATGVLPHTEADGRKAAIAVFKRWLATRGTTGSNETEQAIQLVNNYIAANEPATKTVDGRTGKVISLPGDTKSVMIIKSVGHGAPNEGAQPVTGTRAEDVLRDGDRDGAAHYDPKDARPYSIYYLHPEAFKQACGQLHDPTLVRRTLKDVGLLVHDTKDRLTRVKKFGAPKLNATAIVVWDD